MQLVEAVGKLLLKGANSITIDELFDAYAKSEAAERLEALDFIMGFIMTTVAKPQGQQQTSPGFKPGTLGKEQSS